MRKISKMLMSVFTILILTSTIGIAAKPTPTPNPDEQLQNQRISILEINDTIQQTNNSEQQALIDGIIYGIDIIKNQILQLEDLIQNIGIRTTNLENNQTLYSRTYVFGIDNITGNEITIDGLWQDIASWTFYLPVDSNVYVETSGAFHPVYSFKFNMGIDSRPCLATDGDNCLGPNIREFANYPQSVTYNGFQISKVYYLTKGYHTIYLQGLSFVPDPGIPRPPTKIRPISFNVIASENKGIS